MTPSTSAVHGDRIAVVGAGVSGLVAAYLLAKRHEVVLIEADDRLGGHAHTHDVVAPDGERLQVDTGFIVHNDRTYPTLLRLFAALGISTRDTEMSMSITDEDSGISYAGGRGLTGFLARPRQLADRRYLRMLRAVRRFHAQAQSFLAEPERSDPGPSFGDFLRDRGYPSDFVRLYAVPLVACVWSTGPGEALDYPAGYLFRFLDHHGMLSVGGSPQWRTVVGGSRSYVDAVSSAIAQIRTGDPVRAISRHADGVEIRLGSDTLIAADRVVIATHADTALSMLVDATPEEKQVLGAFRYTSNETILHGDRSLLPEHRWARASWNYLIPGANSPLAGRDRPIVTYDLNRLQGLRPDVPLLVTLGARELIDPAQIRAVMTYRHPVVDAASVAARADLPGLTTARTAYAGAYHGWGFHEDGARAGAAAAAAFGGAW